MRDLVVAAPAALALLGVVAGLLPAAARRWLAPAAGVLLGGGLVVTGAAALAGDAGTLTITTVLPGVTAGYAPDPLGGLFCALVGAVAVTSSLWAAGGAGGAAASRTAWTALPLFVLGMGGVFAAADVVGFLLAWEVMAVASAVLVLTDSGRRPEVLGAGLWYAAMTQLSFLLVLGGFAVLAAEADSTSFAALGTLDPAAAPVAVGVVLLLLGFAAKAGAVPLHVWLPRAHPEAPSHVSALMSAAMVKAGVYGVLLVVVRLLPDGPQWWGALLLGLGTASAVFGILQAGVAADLKRLLAYSTTENVGLMLCATGAAQVVTARGDAATGRVLLVAALLLAVAHAAAKSTLFLVAGSVLHATGLRDLDRLGGLARTMPWTSAAFGVAAVGAAGLPVTAGFVAEWTLLQGLVHAGRPGDPWVGMTSAVTVGVVALTAGLALLTFSKAFGIAVLGRARSEQAGDAHEVHPAERAAVLLGAAAVVGLGLLPGPLASAATTALGAAAAGPDGVTAAGTSLATGVRLDALADAGPAPVLDPVALAVAGLAAAAVLALLAVRLRRRVPRRPVDLAWGCGGVRLSPRMQYTATSYAEPLVRVFDGALGVTRSVATTSGAAPYVVHEMTFRQRVQDVVETRAYAPALRQVTRFADAARRVPDGSVHRYLLWSFGTFVAVLVVAAR